MMYSLALTSFLTKLNIITALTRSLSSLPTSSISSRLWRNHLARVTPRLSCSCSCSLLITSTSSSPTPLSSPGMFLTTLTLQGLSLGLASLSRSLWLEE